MTSAAAGSIRSTAEWRLLAVLAAASRGLATAWWTLIAVRGALPAVFTVAMGALVGAVQAGAALGPSLLLVGVVFVAINALAPVHESVATVLGGRAGAWLQDRLMRACLEPPGLAHLERPDLAEELQTARDFDAGITAPPLGVSMREIGNGFTEIATGLGQALLLGVYRWWAPLLVGGAWLSTHVLLRESALWKVWQAKGVVEQQREVDYNYRLAVDAPAAKEVRLFGLADWVVERFAARRRRFAELLYEERRLRQRPLASSLALIVGANAIVFTALARSAANGELALAQLVVFAGAAVGCASLGFSEFDWWFRGSAMPVPKVLGLAAAMAPAGEVARGTRSAGGLPAREIRFDGVRFAYPGTDVQVLDGFDLVVPAGQSLAIVGHNGAGKTTIAKLLCRLYDPQGGAVRVDGVDLREIDLDGWRARLAAVFQDYVRYELSLRDNVAPLGGVVGTTPKGAIAVGAEDGAASASDQQIQCALELAGAGDLAALDTVLSRQYEGGTDLSGGQWQRVALARALLAVERGAGVVLLDEPTAQLDVRGEAEIFDRLLEATRGSTVILVSHRFSTVRHADRICVLDRGKVVEHGSHDELMAKNGRYRRMFDLQASRFYVEPSEEVDPDGSADPDGSVDPDGSHDGA